MAYASAVVRCLCFIGPVLQETTLWACCLDSTYEIEKYNFHKERTEFEKNKVAEIKEQAVNELNFAVTSEENKLLKHKLNECESYIYTQSQFIKTLKKRKHVESNHDKINHDNVVTSPLVNHQTKKNMWFRSGENKSEKFKRFIKLYEESQKN